MTVLLIPPPKGCFLSTFFLGFNLVITVFFVYTWRAVRKRGAIEGNNGL